MQTDMPNIEVTSRYIPFSRRVWRVSRFVTWTHFTLAFTLVNYKFCKIALRFLQIRKDIALTQRRWQAYRSYHVAERHSFVQAQQRDVVIEIQEAKITSHHAHHVPGLHWFLHASIVFPESDFDHEPHESEKKTRRTDHMRLTSKIACGYRFLTGLRI